MAEAAGHKFGQFVGEYCEKAMEPLLQQFADEHGLYLDKKGKRPARTGELLSWIDSYGNTHNLDYVFERGGTPEKIGTPVAFIESAWRRYTKHSKAKAQEIQGAVLPIADKHHFSRPMLGCILVGDYTAPALEQLRSVGFKILYLKYVTVIEAFNAVGVDARFNEKTPDEEHVARKKQWDELPDADKSRVWHTLIGLNERGLRDFMMHLERAVKRQISSVRIIPLHGLVRDCVNVGEAITFIEQYDEAGSHGPLVKYEVIIRYDNGDKIDAEFDGRGTTIEFLQAYQTGNWTPAIDMLNEEVE